LLCDAVVLDKAFSAKAVNTCVSTVVFGAQWYQCFVVAFTPTASPEMVEFHWRWIMVAM